MDNPMYGDYPLPPPLLGSKAQDEVLKSNGQPTPEEMKAVWTADVAATAELLDMMSASLERFFVLSEAQRIVLPLWALHTYVYKMARLTPYLRIHSPTMACGKSNLMDFLAAHVANPWKTDGCTAAALIRKVDAERPTLLLDETDAAFGREAEYTSHLRGILYKQLNLISTQKSV
jgi:hypothetical protein